MSFIRIVTVLGCLRVGREKDQTMADASSTDDALFLEEIALILDTTEASVGLSTVGETTPLADDLSLLFLNAETMDDMEPKMKNTIQPEERLVSSSRSRACRMRQREELEYLRTQVLELEAQLETLQHTKRSGSPDASSPDDGSPESRPDTTQPSVVWERVAKRQMNAKQKAEAENAKLRDMLQGQLKIARGLERVLRKRTVAQMDVNALETKRRKRADSTEAAMFEQLKRGVDARYHEVQATFRQNGLATNRDDLEDVQVITNDEANELGIEILHAKVLPFDFASTSAAVWRCSTMSYLQLPQGFYAAHPTSDDELTAKFEIPLTVRRQTLMLHVCAALKRYHESDHREVYAWESWSIVQCSHKAYDGIQLRDHGWTVVESLSTNDPTHPTTIVQSCSRLVPDEQSLSKQSPIGILNDVLISSYHRNYATLHETVENMLLRAIV